MQQSNIFEMLAPTFKIYKTVRLIELFAGIGSQATSLEKLGVRFEHHKVVEFDKYAIKSYNAIHGTTFKISDIRDIHAKDPDVSNDDYTYIMTYSFPCQDLSKAGKQKGMDKDSDTRSGLLWEVERILEEMRGGQLPQVLLMENVPDVIGKKNIGNFQKWRLKLEQLGYSNYVECLNAKNYGIPQNRNRCFMVSILGNYYYEFPKPIPLELRLKDLLESNVDEKYYLSEKQISYFESHSIECEEKGNGFRFKPTDGDTIARTCTCHPSQNRMDDNFVIVEGNVNPSGNGMNGNVYGGNIAPTLTTNKGEGIKVIVEGNVNLGNNEHNNRVYSSNGVCPTLDTMQGGNRQPKIIEPMCLNPKADGKQPSIQDRIYDANGISTAITTSFMPSIVEPLICASRGRNPLNPKSRESGEKYVQMIEINYSGCSNTLTTARKDNLVIEEADGIYVGDSKEFHCNPISGISRTLKANKHDAGVVIGSMQKNAYVGPLDGISPSLTSAMGTGGGQIPMIQQVDRGFNNGGLYSNCPPITSSSFQENNFIKFVDIPQKVRVRKYDVDVASLKNCLITAKKQKSITNHELSKMLKVPKTKIEHWFRDDKSFTIPGDDIWMKLKEILGINKNDFDSSIMEFEEKEGSYEKANRCYEEDGIAPTLTCGSTNEKIIENNNKERRIRKLTPLECWRLMGFSDEDFYKAKAVNSNSQLYKQAGNSIVVDVLMTIFKQMI